MARVGSGKVLGGRCERGKAIRLRMPNICSRVKCSCGGVDSIDIFCLFMKE